MRTLVFLVFIAMTGIFIVPNVHSGTYIPLSDKEVYDGLLRLEAEGVITDSLLGTKPLSSDEAVRLVAEAEANLPAGSPFLIDLVDSLKERLRDDLDGLRFVKPLNSFYLHYAYADSDATPLSYNNNGDIFRKGSSTWMGFSSGADLDWFSFYINPEVRYAKDNRETVIKTGYGVLSFLGLDLLVGKDAQWWGPGQHGSILLSNNAQPFTMVRLTNPEPVRLPWILEYLGPFRFDFFATQLEKERLDVPEPYLWGLRLNFKPIPYLDIGLSRTALLGGEGRSASLSTWWKSFTGKGENLSGVEAGDQRAGFDLKLTLPFYFQPVQLYLDAAGEDEAGFLPYKWAYLTGIYLPRILSMERLSLRAEYATTDYSGWYTHHIYKQGYTYKNQIIGHHMGKDSRDIFAEISYLMPENHGKIAISYDREEHNLSGSIREKSDELALTVAIQVFRNTELNATFSHERCKNFNNIAGNDRNISLQTAQLTYRF